MSKSRIKCFFLEETDQFNHYLRRFVWSSEAKCPGPQGYHTTKNFIRVGSNLTNGDLYPHNDPNWPKNCACGYKYKDSDQWQLFTERLYRHQETGELMTIEDAPAGAMYYKDWCKRRGPDGHILCVKTPGGFWDVDSRASNCTRPDDDEHRCWVREGVPPNVTAGKAGNTCSAGAGSILCGKYHGFLRNGYLEEC